MIAGVGRGELHASCDVRRSEIDDPDGAGAVDHHIGGADVLVHHKDLYRDLLEQAWRTADSRREAVIAAILSAMKTGGA